MKAKLFFLFVFAAVVLLSFTVVTKGSTEETTTSANASKVNTTGGFAMEDRNQWN